MIAAFGNRFCEARKLTDHDGPLAVVFDHIETVFFRSRYIESIVVCVDSRVSDCVFKNVI